MEDNEKPVILNYPIALGYAEQSIDSALICLESNLIEDAKRILNRAQKRIQEICPNMEHER